jgi:hypothetical protein
MSDNEEIGMSWTKILEKGAKFGAGWLLAFYLVYMMTNRIAPAIEAVSGQMLTHAIQTAEQRTALDKLITISRAYCINAAKNDMQRERCLE